MRLISMLVWMAPLAMLTIGMMVALRVTRNMIVWMRPVAMLIFGMMLTDRGRDGVLMVVGAGPGDFPEAPKNVFIYFSSIGREV